MQFKDRMSDAPTPNTLTMGLQMSRWRFLSAVAMSLILAACGGGAARREASQTGESSPPASETAVSVVLSGIEGKLINNDWAVNVDPASAPAGNVTFEVEVESGYHALTVLRTDLPPDQLLTDVPDAVDVTDDRIEVVAWNPDPKKDPILETQLDSGAYVLVCNLGGHYARGMWAAFEVY